MFEKEAEEYGEKDLGGKYLSSVVAKDKLHAYKLGQYDGFVVGAEFGYNKANEWHYVKDGDLPKENQLVLLYRENLNGANVALTYWYKSYVKDNVIAWKEIVLPELKESE